MEEQNRSRLIHTPKLEDVPDLIHLIHSLLPVKEAARTCILSKSWLHAWSTNPILMFPTESAMYKELEKHRKHLMMVEHTLLKYLRDNIPFAKIYLKTYIWNHEVGSLADKCIRLLSRQSCLKELELSIGLTVASFTISDELFRVKNLNKIVIRSTTSSSGPSNEIVLTISNAVINCVSLRVLELWDVSISEKVLHRLLSTCSLLEKITLISCRGLKKFKIRNLCYLRELIIHPHGKKHSLEIYDVPTIRSFSYSTRSERNRTPFRTFSLGNVTELSLDGVIISDAFLDVIISKFHCLENLTLVYNKWSPKSLNITSLTLKILSIVFDRWIRAHNDIEVQIYAPKLHFFKYHGLPMPSLKFSAIVPKQIKLLHTGSSNGYDNSFFPKIREALMLTSEFDFHIGVERFDFGDIDVDDVRRGVKFPATNVETLTVETYIDEGLWDHSPFFDAFFMMCHPKHVVSYRDLRFKHSNSFCKLMLKEVIETKTKKGFWPDYLKEVEIKTDSTGGKWETLTNTWKNFLDGSSLVNCYKVEFRLNWFSS